VNGVGVRPVADRVEVPYPASGRLEEADADQHAAPEEQRVAVVREDALVDRAPDDERRRHRGRLPDEPARDRAQHAAALAHDEAPHVPLSRVALLTLSVVHRHTLAHMTTRPPIEARFRRPSVMGVVNVTPDSFSDGGVHERADDAIAAARRMVDEGAAIVDVGGESTRPGSDGVTLDEELRRVVPVLEAVAGELPVSIDTAKAEVARRALELGAELVNDVTALRGDADLGEVVADAGAYLCLMHMQGEPRTMQADPRYDDVASEVAAFLEERMRFAVSQGVDERLICLDPGIGFGKTVEHNIELLRRLDVITSLGRPVVIGFSRKRSLGRLLGDPDATTGSLAASLAAAVTAYERGATIVRVHDVREHVEALTVARAVVA
jgi:dihydropteroate synthase